jgi:hypothetical protein
MNKNDKKQNSKENEKKQKKSFLSGLIQVENKEDNSQEQKQTEESKVPKQKLVEPIKKEQKEKSEDNGLTEEEKLLLNTGEGVNLIPKKSKAEITKEKKKFSFSVSSMVSLLLLIVLSLGVVFFNIFFKQRLSSAKEQLHKRESEIEAYTDKMVSNEEILDRIDLYKYLQRGVFSPKEILEYIMSIVTQSGSITIRSFDLSNTLSFEMDGSTTDLAVVAKLWYLLGIDDNIETINLESVGKTSEGVNFSFAGQLVTSNFIDE